MNENHFRFIINEFSIAFLNTLLVPLPFILASTKVDEHKTFEIN